RRHAIQPGRSDGNRASRQGKTGVCDAVRQASVPDRREIAMAPIPRLQPYEGPALFSYGFRPFFLFGALYAGLAVMLWLPVYAGEITLPTAFLPRDWHVHEMLYGYVPAVV